MSGTRKKWLYKYYIRREMDCNLYYISRVQSDRVYINLPSKEGKKKLRLYNYLEKLGLISLYHRASAFYSHSQEAYIICVEFDLEKDAINQFYKDFKKLPRKIYLPGEDKEENVISS